MAQKEGIRIWYDKEGDFLEIMFARSPGYFRETKTDHVMEKIDMKGKVVGYQIMGLRRVKRPMNIKLQALGITS